MIDNQPPCWKRGWSNSYPPVLSRDFLSFLSSYCLGAKAEAIKLEKHTEYFDGERDRENPPAKNNPNEVKGSRVFHSNS